MHVPGAAGFRVGRRRDRDQRRDESLRAVLHQRLGRGGAPVVYCLVEFVRAARELPAGRRRRGARTHPPTPPPTCTRPPNVLKCRLAAPPVAVIVPPWISSTPAPATPMFIAPVMFSVLPAPIMRLPPSAPTDAPGHPHLDCSRADRAAVQDRQRRPRSACR